jgi:hypothetical protein
VIPAGLGIGAAATFVVGSLALGAVLLISPPTPPPAIWFDQPTTGTELTVGDAVIALHASAERRILQFRVIVTEGQSVVTVLNDTAPDAVSFGVPAVALTTGVMAWAPQPGVYLLTPSYLDTSAWVSGTPITVTVTDRTLPTTLPTIPLPVPTAEPTSEPTEAPVDEPTSTPTPGPTAPPPPAPSPTPSASTPPASPPTGTVRRQVSGTTTTFIAEGISPQNAIVDVQYQITADYNGPAQPSGTWTSLGCGTLSPQAGTSPTKYTCTTAAWVAPGRVSSYRTGHVRVVVTSAGGTVTVYGSNWLIDPYIG